jgi:cell division transport system ATP-binding protein
LTDEPTGNLDPETSWEIMKLLFKINVWGTTVVVASHDKLMVDKAQKRVIRLEQGEVVSDTKKGIYSQ